MWTDTGVFATDFEVVRIGDNIANSDWILYLTPTGEAKYYDTGNLASVSIGGTFTKIIGTREVAFGLDSAGDVWQYNLIVGSSVTFLGARGKSIQVGNGMDTLANNDTVWLVDFSNQLWQFRNGAWSLTGGTVR